MIVDSTSRKSGSRRGNRRRAKAKAANDAVSSVPAVAKKTMRTVFQKYS